MSPCGSQGAIPNLWEAHTTERDWRMGGELECLDSNSILCVGAIVHACVFFPPQYTMYSFVCWFDFVATCVWWRMCGIISFVATARQSLHSSLAGLAQPLHLGIQSERQHTFGPPVQTRDDGRGRGPRSLPCQQLPLVEQAAAGPSVQGSALAHWKVGHEEGKERRKGHVEGKRG